MATYVLVHGAWHGGWCWRQVTPRLRAAGHEVHVPTLTGLGERAHLLAREVGLDTHIEDVVATMRGEDIGRSILVGHSYGGMVISGVADRVPEQLARLVYLDAFVPDDGQSVMDLAPPEVRDAHLAAARERGEGWRVPVPPLAIWGVTDPAHLAWVEPRVGPHPLRTMTDRIRLSNPARQRIPRTFVSCTVQQRGAFVAAAAKVRAQGGWDCREIAAPHDAMIVAPEALAALLLDLAG